MASDKYILQEVVSPRLEREWLDLPKKIYRGNRNWVCPLDSDIRAVFDPAATSCSPTGRRSAGSPATPPGKSWGASPPSMTANMR